jgi:tyrosyl-tRNA synthetase
MQGYDSVMIQADLEIGATEQKFNLVIGRQIQKEYGQEPQVVLTLPVLEGTDGTQRMSKSLGNYIGIDEPPAEIYGKTMSIPDKLIYPYYELITDIDLKELKQIKIQLEDQSFNPMELKRALARHLVKMYYDATAATEAEAKFNLIHKQGEVPQDIPEYKVGDKSRRVIEIMVESGLVAGKGEARRLIRQGGVKLDGETITDELLELTIDREKILKVGKRKFLKLLRD